MSLPMSVSVSLIFYLSFLVRKWKKPREFGVATWEIEIGQEQTTFNPESDLLAVNNQNPVFIRKDTESRFEWRIRNLPYPKETYSIEIDHNKQEVVLRTTNKKYYKRFDIPDMKRIGLKLEESDLVWKYQNNTVIIGYDKPEQVIEMEKRKKQEITTMGNDPNTGYAGKGGRPSGSAAQSLLGGPSGGMLGGPPAGQNPDCKQQ